VPRYGRLYTSTVLRPLAEQAVLELHVQAGQTVCDLMCDCAALGEALGAAAGSRGEVVLVDTDSTLLEESARDVAASGCAVSIAISDGRKVPLGSSSCDRVGSLCTLGFWDGESLFDTAARVTRPGGIAALLTWGETDPPLHEAVLAEAVRDVTGVASPFLTRCLAHAGAPDTSRWEALTLHDVVRFDGMDHFWAAMVAERPLAAELAGNPTDLTRGIRDACEQRLRSRIAADGTMRIPVTATLWRYGLL